MEHASLSSFYFNPVFLVGSFLIEGTPGRFLSKKAYHFVLYGLCHKHLDLKIPNSYGDQTVRQCSGLIISDKLWTKNFRTFFLEISDVTL